MTAERLANSSERLRDSSLSLDTGARNQSDSVRKTAASVEEISASVQQTASNTSLATDLSASASRLAQDGNEVVLESVGAIGRLSNSFTEISSLVDGLDEIAFQTNILSINAAIEAANAGELGKSFAVVASEVRRLAMKSTSTARDAAKLIANSLENLHFSAEAVARSGTALSALVQNSQKVSATVSDISNAAKEESEGIRSIERAIEVLDSSSAEGSRQTSALLATAQDLDAAAQSLRTLVATADIKA